LKVYFSTYREQSIEYLEKSHSPTYGGIIIISIDIIISSFINSCG